MTGPNGAKVEIPAGALAASTPIAIEQTSNGSPALPGGLTSAGAMFAFTPHGTTFAVPVTITVPFDSAVIPAGATPRLFKTNSSNQWEPVANATFGANTVTAEIAGFSFVQPVFDVSLVGREFSFIELRSTENLWEEVLLDEGLSLGGRLSEFRDLGPTSFDAEFALIDGRTFLPDGFASAAIESEEDGTTFNVRSEAPRGTALGARVGAQANLVQLQSFIKRSEDATLTMTLPAVLIEAHDENAILGRKCPANRVLGKQCILLSGFLQLRLEAMTHDLEENEVRVFYQRSGGIYLNGFAKHWTMQVYNDAFANDRLWGEDDFDLVEEDFNDAANSHARLSFATERRFEIDLASIPLDSVFHVRVTARSETLNLIGGPPSEFATSIGAYLRQGLATNGEIVEFAGLEPIEAPEELISPDSGNPNAPVQVPPPSAPCTGGSNPAAGTVQFSASAFVALETGDVPTITVTRTNGSTGAISAAFTTSDGTATSNADYQPLTTQVFFADGDAAPRTVALSILADLEVEADETVNLALSQPGGCAVLGAQETAVLTILDDEPEPAGPSGLDPTFGDGGEASSEAFGGDRSAMALQADGKIVMVGGTFTDFVLARFDADGSLDDTFGDEGTVTTDMVSNEQEEALGVAIQPDGRIVVVGYTGQATGPSVLALARYDRDGRPDESFGVGGKAISNVVGRAFAVALQPDGRIVVAGDEPANEDFVIARFESNGTLDDSFAVGGFLTTDIDDGADLASNVVLQSDGSIVISGPHTNVGELVRELHTGLMRLDSEGNPDDAFGTQGKVLLTNDSVGAGLAVQSDGKLVLAGRKNVAAPPALLNQFAVMRLNANGGPDGTFGSQGRVSTPISNRGDEALAVAVQADGRIIVAGRSNSQVNSNFALARYTSAGVLDSSFGDDGIVEVDFFGFTDIAESVAIMTDGRIVAGGLARDNVDGYGVVRVLP